ncbi:hypothetical protein AB1K81_16190 [Ornithinibacillus sp. 179-J 7C1 HS]
MSSIDIESLEYEALAYMTDGEDLIQINKAHKRLGKLPAKDFGKNRK